MKRQAWTASAATVGLLLSLNAEAHIVSVRLGDFFMGALHPMTDPIDWFVWLGLALLGARSGREAARWLVVAVPLALAIGLWIVLLSGRLPPAFISDALPLLAVGLLLASGYRLRTIGLLGVVAGLMVLRGAANAAGLRLGADLPLYVGGLMSAGYVAMTLLAALTARGIADEATVAWRRIGVRVLGSWLAAAGLMLFALGLRG
ncbi:MAG: HupE/UreJ family protein [Pseudomonadota bacterium]|jgi:hypothetical protein